MGVSNRKKLGPPCFHKSDKFAQKKLFINCQQNQNKECKKRLTKEKYWE